MSVLPTSDRFRGSLVGLRCVKHTDAKTPILMSVYEVKTASQTIAKMVCLDRAVMQSGHRSLMDVEDRAGSGFGDDMKL